LEPKHYDYLIIGGGLSGLQLAKAIADHDLLQSKTLAIVEPKSKSKNDKTWCFWEKGEGKWDQLVSHVWHKAKVNTPYGEKHFDLAPYQYKKVRSVDFYEALIPELKKHPQITWIEDEVIDFELGEKHLIKGKNKTYTTAKLFDSSPPKKKGEAQYPYVLQHFKGKVIETTEDMFDPKAFTMMDFSVGYQDQCCFTYVLPTSSKRALIEFTFFTPSLVDKKTYDELIEVYLKQAGVENFSVEEVEAGVIPMTSFPFWKENTHNYMRIGTAGGWVKASSGYSFKNTEKQVAKIIELLQAEKGLDTPAKAARFQWYDDLFLRVLYHQNKVGNKLFTEMYNRNSIQSIFEFLDEESDITEEVKLINRFSKLPFLKALTKKALT